MSQHHFRTERAGSPVSVLLGFDRPLGHYYLVVQDLAAQHRAASQPGVSNEGSEDDEDGFDGESDGCLYSNLYELDAFELSLAHYQAVLARLGIQVPATMFEQVELDALNRAGNRHVIYAPDGSFTEQ